MVLNKFSWIGIYSRYDPLFKLSAINFLFRGEFIFLEDYDTSNIRYFSQAYSDYTWNFLAVTYSYQENMYRIYLNGDL